MTRQIQVLKVKDKQVHFRFYEELNDFLPPGQRKVTFTLRIPANVNSDSGST